MALVSLQEVTLTFPIFDISKRSLLTGTLQRRVGASPTRHGSTAYVTALKDINICLRAGERVALIGPNGAGKSTLLQVIARIYSPQKGTVNVEGRTSPLFNSMIGINADETGYENIYNRAVLFGVSRKLLHSTIDDITETSGLGNYLDLPVRSYSTGMRARLAFSMNLMIKPDILLLDEWIGFVDHDFSNLAEKRLMNFTNDASIIVIATHNEQILERLCTRAIYMRGGAVFYQGDPVDAIRHYYEDTYA